MVVVGESGRNGETINDGRAYIFDSDGNLLAILQSPEPYLGAMFGYSVDVSEDTVAVGERYATVEGESKAGLVHVFGLGEPAAEQPAPEEETTETETEPETESEKGGGIPGFPLESIVISIVLAVSILWLLQRQR